MELCCTHVNEVGYSLYPNRCWVLDTKSSCVCGVCTKFVSWK